MPKIESHRIYFERLKTSTMDSILQKLFSVKIGSDYKKLPTTETLASPTTETPTALASTTTLSSADTKLEMSSIGSKEKSHTMGSAAASATSGVKASATHSRTQSAASKAKSDVKITPSLGTLGDPTYRVPRRKELNLDVNSLLKRLTRYDSVFGEEFIKRMKKDKAIISGLIVLESILDEDWGSIQYRMDNSPEVTRGQHPDDASLLQMPKIFNSRAISARMRNYAYNTALSIERCANDLAPGDIDMYYGEKSDTSLFNEVITYLLSNGFKMRMKNRNYYTDSVYGIQNILTFEKLVKIPHNWFVPKQTTDSKQTTQATTSQATVQPSQTIRSPTQASGGTVKDDTLQYKLVKKAVQLIFVRGPSAFNIDKYYDLDFCKNYFDGTEIKVLYPESVLSKTSESRTRFSLGDPVDTRREEDLKMMREFVENILKKWRSRKPSAPSSDKSLIQSTVKAVDSEYPLIQDSEFALDTRSFDTYSSEDMHLKIDEIVKKEGPQSTMEPCVHVMPTDYEWMVHTLYRFNLRRIKYILRGFKVSVPLFHPNVANCYPFYRNSIYEEISF